MFSKFRSLFSTNNINFKNQHVKQKFQIIKNEPWWNLNSFPDLHCELFPEQNKLNTNQYFTQKNFSHNNNNNNNNNNEHLKTNSIHSMFHNPYRDEFINTLKSVGITKQKIQKISQSPKNYSLQDEFIDLLNHPNISLKREQLADNTFCYGIPTNSVIQEITQKYIFNYCSSNQNQFNFHSKINQKDSSLSSYYNQTSIPLLDLGAGTGYWSYLFKQAGVTSIIACDPDIRNRYENRKLWHPVVNLSIRELFDPQLKQRRGIAASAVGMDSIDDIPYYQGTALLVWPYYSMFEELMNTCWQGRWLIVVGEVNKGCTGDPLTYFKKKQNRLIQSKQKEEWKIVDSFKIPNWLYFRDFITVFERIEKNND